MFGNPMREIKRTFSDYDVNVYDYFYVNQEGDCLVSISIRDVNLCYYIKTYRNNKLRINAFSKNTFVISDMFGNWETRRKITQDEYNKIFNEFDKREAEDKERIFQEKLDKVLSQDIPKLPIDIFKEFVLRIFEKYKSDFAFDSNESAYFINCVYRNFYFVFVKENEVYIKYNNRDDKLIACVPSNDILKEFTAQIVNKFSDIHETEFFTKLDNVLKGK